MFDVFRSRDKAVRILLGVILGVVALSMVTYLVPGGWLGGDSQSTGSDNVLAQVGGHKVTVAAAQIRMNRMMQGRSVPPEMMRVFAPQIVQGMIGEQAMAYEAERLGLRVSDAELAQAIRAQIPQQFFKDGQIDRDLYARVLADQGMTIPQFEENVRQDMLVGRLRNLVAQGIVVAPGEVEAEYKRRNEKAKVQYVLLTPGRYAAQAQPTPEEIQAFYNKNKASFQTPEKRTLAVVVIDPAKGSAAASDADLQKLYNTEKDKFRTPDRVKVRHILVKTDAAKKDEDAKRAKAQGLLDQLKKGGDFAALAKANSDDTGSAVRGGELDWIVKGQTVPEFEKAAFSLEPGKLSDLVKTTYGYHILQVEQKETAHLRPFEEVKAELTADYTKVQANKAAQELTDKVTAALKKNPTQPEKAITDPAAESLSRVENYTAGEPIPGVGVSQEFDTAVGALKKGEVSGPVVLPGNKVAVGVVLDSVAPHQASLAEAEGQIRTTLVKQKTDNLLNEHAADLAVKTRQMNGDLAAAAKALGLEVKTSNDFDRQGAIEGLGSASMIADVFAKPDAAIVGPIIASENRAVVKVLSHTPADMTQFAAQSKLIGDELRSKIARERSGLFEDGLRARLQKEKKIKINQDALARMTRG